MKPLRGDTLRVMPNALPLNFGIGIEREAWMKLTRIPTDTLSVFKTFDGYRIPDRITVASKDGDVSMLNDLPMLGLAIVGTRLPQTRSVQLLEETLYELRNTRLVIVSGFARGIDSHAHQLAIKNGLRTIAVLGCGISLDYPKENARLRAEIIESGGLVISQFEDDAQPLSRNFYNRNAVIAGFSKATWVVEAAEISGTLNTAKHANDFNRDLYATSCFPTDHYYQGNVKLLSQGLSHKYPVAHPFFNAQSFGVTWDDLKDPASASQTSLVLESKPKTEIQKWVLDLKASSGDCMVQALMDYASKKGYTLGKFYQKFESEVDAGLLKHDSSGRVDVVL